MQNGDGDVIGRLHSGLLKNLLELSYVRKKICS